MGAVMGVYSAGLASADREPMVASDTFDLQRFIADCRAARGDVRAVADIVRAAVAQPAAVRAALAAAGANDRVLYQDDEITVLNVRIPAGYRTPPHDHVIWAVVGIYEGQEDNTFYRLDAGRPVPFETHAVCAPGVLTLDGTTIHAIANPLASVTAGLHVYGGHLDDAPRSLWDPDTGAREPFTVDGATRITKRLMRQAAQ